MVKQEHDYERPIAQWWPLRLTLCGPCLAFLVACSSPAESAPSCVAGETQPCFGPAACVGVQTCMSGGRAWSECVCEPTDGGPLSDATNEAASDATTDRPRQPPPLPDPNGPLTLVLDGTIARQDGTYDVTGTYPMDPSRSECVGWQIMLGCLDGACVPGGFHEAGLTGAFPSPGTHPLNADTFRITISLPNKPPNDDYAVFSGSSEGTVTVTEQDLLQSGSAAAHGNISAVSIGAIVVTLDADVDFWIAGICE